MTESVSPDHNKLRTGSDEGRLKVLVEYAWGKTRSPQLVSSSTRFADSDMIKKWGGNGGGGFEDRSELDSNYSMDRLMSQGIIPDTYSVNRRLSCSFDVALFIKFINLEIKTVNQRPRPLLFLWMAQSIRWTNYFRAKVRTTRRGAMTSFPSYRSCTLTRPFSQFKETCGL